MFQQSESRSDGSVPILQVWGVSSFFPAVLSYNKLQITSQLSDLILSRSILDLLIAKPVIYSNSLTLSDPVLLIL